MRPLPIAVLMAMSFGALAQSAPPSKLYAVVFHATVDSSGKLDALEISKVIDPGTGTTDPVNVDVPASYVSAARSFLSKRTYDPDPPSFYTYTFYDPSQPSRADIDPHADH